jgi:hypothetical protein
MLVVTSIGKSVRPFEKIHHADEIAIGIEV